MSRPIILFVTIALLAQRSLSEPAFIPKLPKAPEPVRPEPVIVPAKPNAPQPGWNIAPDAAPRPTAVQANMQRLNEQLREIAKEGAKEAGTSIVEAILETAAPATATAGIDASDATVTATPTFDISAFYPCRYYASSLSSCASASPSFYSLDPTAQASCACYSTPSTNSTVSCSTTTAATVNSRFWYYQTQAVPTLVPNDFDDQANACWQFFNSSGYENVASAMLDSSVVPGALFCSSLDEALKGGNGTTNGTAGTGLPETLVPITDGICASERKEVSSGAAKNIQKGVLLIVVTAMLLAS